jgi:hypothetical protein
MLSPITDVLKNTSDMLSSTTDVLGYTSDVLSVPNDVLGFTTDVLVLTTDVLLVFSIKSHVSCLKNQMRNFILVFIQQLCHKVEQSLREWGKPTIRSMYLGTSDKPLMGLCNAVLLQNLTAISLQQPSLYYLARH